MNLSVHRSVNFRSVPFDFWLLSAVLAFGLLALPAQGQSSAASGSSNALTSDAQSPAQNADAQAADPAPEVAEMQKIADLWDEAVNQRDSYGLDLVLSPKLVDISSSGQVSSRDEMVAKITQKNSGVISLNQTVAKVNRVGALAIVNGTYAFKFHEDREGRKLKDETGVYSQVFEWRQNTWVCVNSQRTALTALTGHSVDKKKSLSQKDDEMQSNPFGLAAVQH